MGRILALDYGRQRIGVAVSDQLGITAQPLDTWEGLKFDQIVEKLRLVIQKFEIDKIIIGLPLTMKGERGHLAGEVEQMAVKMRQILSIPFILWDERLTSVQAKQIIHRMNKKPSRHKEKVDVIASILLLQNYLDFQKGMSDNDGGTI